MGTGMLDASNRITRTPSRSLAAHIDEVRQILSQYDISEPRVFGSVARNSDGTTSDLDLLVKVGPTVSHFDLAELELRLEALLGCPVDIVTEKGLGGSALRSAFTDAVPL